MYLHALVITMENVVNYTPASQAGGYTIPVAGDSAALFIQQTTFGSIRSDNEPAIGSPDGIGTKATVVSPPSVTIHLDYTKASHVLTGEALKDVYVNFRLEILRVVPWATWHGRLTRDPAFTKGWNIKKEFLPLLEETLTKYGIPFTKVNSANINQNPKTAYGRFLKDNKPVVVAGLPVGATRKQINDELKKMWKTEKKNPNTIYKQEKRAPVKAKGKAGNVAKVKGKAKGKAKRVSSESSSDTSESTDEESNDEDQDMYVPNEVPAVTYALAQLKQDSLSFFIEEHNRDTPVITSDDSQKGNKVSVTSTEVHPSGLEVEPLDRLKFLWSTHPHYKAIREFMSQTGQRWDTGRVYVCITNGDVNKAVETLQTNIRIGRVAQVDDVEDTDVTLARALEICKQDAGISEFMTRTGESYAEAMDYLGVTDGDVDRAVEMFENDDFPQ